MSKAIAAIVAYSSTCSAVPSISTTSSEVSFPMIQTVRNRFLFGSGLRRRLFFVRSHTRATLSPMPRRRLPAPWTVQRTPGGYCIRDAAGHVVAYTYVKDPSGDVRDLTLDEARRIAVNIAKLPELLRHRTT